MLATTDYLVIGFYLAILVGIGLAFRKANRGTDDYYRSGCQGTWWLVGMGAFIGTTGPGTFVAAAGMHFEAGWTAYSYGALALLSWILLIVPAAWFRQSRCVTVPEMVSKRFGTGLQQFYAVMNILLAVLGSAVQLWALAGFCATLFGYDVNVTILALGIVVTVYATVGGLWAVLGTSFIQGMVMLPIAFLVSFLALYEVGGISGFAQRMQQFPELQTQWAFIKSDGVFASDAYTIQWLLAMSLLLIPQAFSMGSASRFFSVKNGQDARKAQMLAVALYVPTLLLWCIPSLVARLMYSDQVMSSGLSKPSESAFAVASMNVLPRELTVLIGVALFASGAGVLCALLNQNAAMLTEDVFPAVRRLLWGGQPNHEHQKVGDKPTRRLLAAKVCTVVSGVILVVLSLWFAGRGGLGVFETMLQITALLWLPMTAPMFLGVLIRQTPKWSAPLSISCGFAVSLWAFLGDWSFVGSVVGVWLASHVSFVLTVPWYASSSALYREKVDAFFAAMHTPVDFQAEVGESRDVQQLQTLGQFTLLAGVLLLSLMLMVNDLRGVVCVLAVAGSVIFTGSLLLYRARRMRAFLALKPAEGLAVPSRTSHIQVDSV